VTIDDVRDLFAYDRWATERLLAALDGIDEGTWSASQVIDERGLGGILVHMLGAYQRWRHGLIGDDELPRPEREPLLSPDELRSRWEAEWPAMDSFLASRDDAWLAGDDEGVRFDRMLQHLANHGTQHRAEAAVLLSQAGRSPGDLDLIVWLEARAGWNDGVPPSQQHPGGGSGRR
jgi:uncharacterized damage-inducible protein DinB